MCLAQDRGEVVANDWCITIQCTSLWNGAILFGSKLKFLVEREMLLNLYIYPALYTITTVLKLTSNRIKWDLKHDSRLIFFR